MSFVYLHKLRGLRRSSLAHSVSANGLNQVINLIIQFAGVPILIQAFGQQQYGEYLALFAIPSFLLFADMGLGISLSNKLTIAYSSGDVKLAQRYASTKLAFTLMLSAVILVMSILLQIISFRSTFGLLLFDDVYYNKTFSLLLLLALSYHFVGVIGYFLRALNKNALGIVFATIQIVAINIVIWTTALMTGDMLTTALYALIVELIIVACLILYYRKNYSHLLKFNIKHFSWLLLCESLRPALSYLLFPMGNALLVNGLTIIVNKFAGAPAVITFTTTRTLASIIKQGSLLVSKSIWPEYSVAYGKRNFARIKTLFDGSFKATLLISFTLFTMLATLSGLIYLLWLGPQFILNTALLLMMLGSGVFYSLWSSAIALPSSINKFDITGKFYFAVAIASIVILLVAGANGISIFYLTAIVLLAGDILLFLIFYPYCKRILSSFSEV